MLERRERICHEMRLSDIIIGNNKLERYGLTMITDTMLFIKIVTMFALAFGIAFVLTPLSIRLAHKIGAVDVPLDKRRMHSRPIPRFGGIALFLSTTISILLLNGSFPKIQIALIGGAFMYLLGAIDDLKNLKPLTKATGQVVIACFVYMMDIRIDYISMNFAGGKYNFGDGLSLIITVLWIVGITNAVNLIDGLDGLAGGVTCIIALSLAYIAYIHGSIYGSVSVMLSLMALAGACAGFLPYNFSPAKTFMGDGGALFLGYMIAVLSVISPLKRATFIAAITPIVALAIPIFDTLFAIIRRTVKRIPILEGDKGHLHHRLMKAGYGQRRSVLIIYGIVGIMGMVSVLISRELYKDAFFLSLIAVLYLCVILIEKKPKNKHHVKGKPSPEETEVYHDVIKAPKEIHDDRD